MNQETASTSEDNSKRGEVIRISEGNEEDSGFRFVPNDDPSVQMRLTRIRMMEALPPLGAPNEIDLAQFEGKEITVRGHFSGDIVYEASIDEEGNTSQYSS